jgi:hypothetical protein
MRISNEQDDDGKEDSAFARLVQLQSDFQSRLVDETLRYLQKLRGPLSPTAPGTVVRAGSEAELRARATIGGEVAIELELENRQRAYAGVMPQVSSLVGADGTTWFPETTVATASTLIAPGAVGTVRVTIAVPLALPSGVYRGALILLGFRGSSVPLSVLVADPAAPPAGDAEA